MRVISEEKLIKLAFRIDDHNTVVSLDDALAECRELQEPWIPIDEFLKSGFNGWCWINIDNCIHIAYLREGNFQFNDISPKSFFTISHITHVMPIHRPEPPR